MGTFEIHIRRAGTKYTFGFKSLGYITKAAFKNKLLDIGLRSYVVTFKFYLSKLNYVQANLNVNWESLSVFNI